MTAAPIRLLLLEDDRDDAELLRVALAKFAPGGFAITHVERLADALERIRTGQFDVLLSDLGLPDSTGLATVQAIAARAPALPLVVLTGFDDDELGRAAIEDGAQDYLVKGETSGALMGRTLRYAIERKRFEIGLRAANEALAGRVAERTAELEAANAILFANAASYRQLFDANPHPMYMFDPETLRLLTVNDAAVAHYGWSREEFLAMTIADIRPAGEIQRLRDHIARVQRKDIDEAGFWKHRRKDGTLIDVEISSHAIELGGRRARVALAHDITERRRAEEALRENEARFRSLTEMSSDFYWESDVEHRLALLSAGGKAREVPALQMGARIGKPRWEMPHLAPDEAGWQAHRVVLDAHRPFRDFAFSRLDADGTERHIAVSGDPVFDASGAFRGYRGVGTDISEKRRAEEAIQRYVAQLETSFMSTVVVVTTLCEMRDPYTAGHERRVAEIAVAIGAELGFDARRQEGLRVAGYLHDIGKITIPSEILSKPGRLSAIEFKLIQGHPQASSDVLKDVEFPWAVADVALQHHERVDGSGYPHGLKGEAILLEARIVTVADVVEAMSSHRPYRPGLGIEAALTEIEGGRGSAYDPVVANACLRLFREKGYAVPA